jgi:hypothetical protein
MINMDRTRLKIKFKIDSMNILNYQERPQTYIRLSENIC